MSELTPITRIESYLDAIVNSGIPPTEDITRIETFLQAIYDNQVCALTPVTRIEMFLGKISGQSLTLPEPVTRVELYLAAIAGEDVELPEMPITRIEMYLADWADSGDWTTISGAIVEFVTQRAHKLKSCVVSLSPQQDLSHGDPSPTNICPISGWTGCEVFVSGKNLFDKTKAVLYNNVPRFIKYGVDNYADTLPNGDCVLDVGTYTLSIGGDGTEAPASMTAFDSNGNRLAIVYNNKILTFTTTSAGACYLAINFTDAVTWADYNIQLELGSTASDYEPFRGNSYSVTWEDEVFGGSAEVVEGKRIVDRSVYTITGQEAFGSFLVDTNTTRVYLTSERIPSSMKPNNTSVCMIMCDKLPTFEPDYIYRNDVQGISENRNLTSNGLWIRINNSSLAETTLSGIQAYLAANQITVCYYIAAPIETDITPTPITALKGYNAMWSDAGDIEVTVHGTPVELSTQQALNMLLGGAYRNNQTADDVSDEEALEIILGGKNR